MRIILFVLGCIITCSLRADIESFLINDLKHVTPSIEQIDALFVIKNNRIHLIDPILNQLKENHINTSLNELFTGHSLPEKAITQYCSENISPELLAQILNHISIYKYALNKKLSTILIVEAESTLKGDVKDIEKALKELFRTDSNWDILFLNTDYCTGKNGEEHIVPQIIENGVQKRNKAMISQHLSKLFYRYGCSSYVISHRGMKKMVRFFRQNWPNLPLDQVLFRVPSLRFYTVNKDLLINGLYPKNSSEEMHDYLQKEHYPLGKEFWVEPIELLNTSRFDIIIKYLYAKSYLENKDNEIYKNYYLEHIKGWNNFYEGKPLKIGANAFLTEFHKLIYSLQRKNYDPLAEPVPISSSGEVINGSHRVGACMALNIPVRVKVVKMEKKKQSFANIMHKLHRVSKDTIYQLVKEYIILKPNTYALKSLSKQRDFSKQISQYVDIVYTDEGEGLYIIEAEDWEMVESLIKDTSLSVFSHEETRSILCL